MSEVSGATPDLAPLLERVFDRVPEESSYRVEPSEGAVPAWMRGTYYLNGPARFRRGERAYNHWLDGDGMVCSLRFDPDGDEAGGPRFTSRFVRSEKLAQEEEAGCALFRCFGTGFAGDRLLRGIALASPVNVSVYPFAGKLLAFGEQGLPWELDPETLETVGEHTFGGRLNAVSPFSAHPGFDRPDPMGEGEAQRSGGMVNFGVSFSAERPTLNLYRFDGEGALLYRKRVPLPYPASIHDFGLSKQFAVFYVNPYLLDMRPLMEEGATVLDCLSWQPERGSSLLVVERETGEVAASVPIGERYCLHHVNAFEPEPGRLVVDVLELEEPVYPDYTPVPDLFVDVAPAHPVRYVLDLSAGESGAVVERREAPYWLAADFPAIDPRRAGEPTDRFWMLAISRTGERGRKFLDRLVAIDFALDLEEGGRIGEEAAEADAWQAPAGRYLGGEPVFVPRPGGRGGVIVVQELDAERREMAFLLFDAYRLSEGPVARLPLEDPVHLGFHACWDPA